MTVQQQSARRESAKRSAQRAEVLGAIDIGTGKSAGEIQQQILAAYKARGYEPPTDYSRRSRFMAAGTGRRGTRTIRLFAETVRGVRAGRQWIAANLNEPGEATDEGQRLQARGGADRAMELRRMRRAAAGLTAVSVAAGAGAYFARGPTRLALIVIGALVACVAAWVSLWAFGSATSSALLGLPTGITNRPDRSTERAQALGE